jgi:hypothetical protein
MLVACKYLNRLNRHCPHSEAQHGREGSRHGCIYELNAETPIRHGGYNRSMPDHSVRHLDI